MATEVEIANMAAIAIGSETRITSLNDDKTLARALRAAWAINRRATIRDGSWNFAARRGTLAKVVIDDASTIYPYASAFALPSDALRLIEILNVDARDSYQLEGDRVLCNSDGPLYARWLIDVPEPASWGDDFAHAFAARLAWQCGRKIVGSDFGAERAEAEYRRALSDAKGVDAKENPPIEQEESDWILARYRRTPSTGR